VAWLSAEAARGPRVPAGAEAALFLPLLVPQAAFLYGLGVVALRWGGAGGMALVAAGHAVFVLPYVFLALAGPWRGLDPGLMRAAAALGAGPVRRLVAVRLPALAGPLATAAAIGFSVSVALYLPTLFLGGGRVATLTTEAVTLAAGADRRIAAAHAATQAALPLAAFGLALALPAVVWRNRRALRGGRA
jgi:putative thiamine transport system permease protein